MSWGFFFGTKRRADLDNFNKLSLDALTGIAYNDDSQIAGLHIYKRQDTKNPRIEVTIIAPEESPTSKSVI